MAKRPNSPEDDNSQTSADDSAGATAFVRIDQAPPPPDDAAGATAFVRIDKPGPSKGSHPIPPRRPVPPSAPKKGLQISLPDDEPAPAPKPKPKIEAPPPGAKGRRGAWWDEKSAPLGDDEASDETSPGEAPVDESEEPTNIEAPPEPEPAADDAPGATAFLKVEAKPAPRAPPPRRKAPEAPPPAEAAAPAADDGRTQFFKPEQVVLDSDVRQRPAPTPPPESSIPWKQLFIGLAVAAVVSVLILIFAYRKDLFRHTGAHKKTTAHSTDTTGGDSAGE